MALPSYEYIGFAAATLTTCAFVPQLIKAWKTQQTRDISLGMMILFIIGVTLWLIYGIILMSWPIILANIVTVMLAGILLTLKLKHG